MIRISTYKIRIPSPGQEGGGVAWSAWQHASDKDFKQVLETAESGKCGSCIIRGYTDAHSFFEIDINAYTGKPTYSVRRPMNPEAHEVSYSEFRRLLKVDTVVMGIDIGGEMEIVEAQPDPDVEYLYRYRHFTNPDHAWKNSCGWTAWEYCDEKKFNEIAAMILRSNAPYQAQRIPVEIDQQVSVDLKARGWCAPRYRYRKVSVNHSVPEGDITEWVAITRDQLWKLKQSEADRRDTWNEYEVSRDEGTNWEAL